MPAEPCRGRAGPGWPGPTWRGAPGPTWRGAPGPTWRDGAGADLEEGAGADLEGGAGADSPRAASAPDMTKMPLWPRLATSAAINHPPRIFSDLCLSSQISLLTRPMSSAHDNIEFALLGYCVPSWTPTCRRIATAMAALVGRKNDLSFCLFHPQLFSRSFLTSEPISSLLHGGHRLLLVIFDEFGSDQGKLRLKGRWEWWGSTDGPEVVESEVGVVAADDRRCSEIRVGALKAGRHAFDAAVATMLCLKVVHHVLSGLGDGAFMIVRLSDFGKAEAFDSWETSPSAASKIPLYHTLSLSLLHYPTLISIEKLFYFDAFKKCWANFYPLLLY